MDATSKEKLYRFSKRVKAITRRVQKADISARNKKLIFEFRNHITSKGLSPVRAIQYMERLRQIALAVGKDLDKFGQKDVEKAMAWVNSPDRNNGKAYSPATVNCFITTFKVYHRYLNSVDSTEPAPKLVRWLKPKRQETKLKREDLLTSEDIKKMINHASHLRDKALIGIAYDTGARPGELRSVRIKDIIRNTYGYKLIVRGKTGRRSVFIVTSEKLLTDWLNQHPHKDDPEAPIFCNLKRNTTNPITDTYISHLFKNVAKRASIDKPVTPYLFRHSRLTYLTVKKVPEATIRKFAGHSPTSKALATYQHLVDDDVEDAVIELDTGVKRKKGQEFTMPTYEKKACPRCRAVCAPTDVVCERCHAVIDEAGVVKYETDMGMVLSSKGVSELTSVLRPMIQEELDRLWQKKQTETV